MEKLKFKNNLWKVFLLFVFSFSLLTYSGFAQKSLVKRKPTRFAFGYNEGHGYPKGDYGKGEPSELPLSKFTKQDTSKLFGYAQGGFHFDLYLSYKIKPNLGIMFAVSGDQDPYNISFVNLQYENYFSKSDIVITTGDSYYIVQYLIGPFYDLPIYKKPESNSGEAPTDNAFLQALQGKFSIEFKALGGLTTGNYPSLDYSGSTPFELDTYPKGSGFGYFFSAGIKYTATVEGIIGIGIHFNVNYAGSTLGFSNYSETFYTGNNSYINSNTYNIPRTMSFGILQLTLGASLEI